MKQFTNEATQQMLADFDKSPFSDADLAAMDVDARQIIEQNAEKGSPTPGNSNLACCGRREA